MLRLILRKFNNKSGESITETLVALLIMTLVMIAFAGSVVTAARINERAGRMVTASHMDTEDSDADSGCELTSTDKTVEIYHYDNSTGSITGSAAVGKLAVTFTKETHKDEKYKAEDSFYFYAIKK